MVTDLATLDAMARSEEAGEAGGEPRLDDDDDSKKRFFPSMA